MAIAHNHIEECLVTEVGRLRAVLAEQRAYIKRLHTDHDADISAIIQARTALQTALQAVTMALQSVEKRSQELQRETPMELKPDEEVVEPKNSNRIRGLAEKIAGTMTNGG